MRRELICATAGVVAGWMMFSKKGQETTKDICMMALQSGGMTDDASKVLCAAVMEEAPALEESRDEHHKDHQADKVAHDETSHHSDHQKMHTVETEAHEKHLHVSTAPADAPKEVKEVDHAIS